jgi:hypothetical protein
MASLRITLAIVQSSASVTFTAKRGRLYLGRGAGFRDFLCLLPAQENRASRKTLPEKMKSVGV